MALVPKIFIIAVFCTRSSRHARLEAYAFMDGHLSDQLSYLILALRVTFGRKVANLLKLFIDLLLLAFIPFEILHSSGHCFSFQRNNVFLVFLLAMHNLFYRAFGYRFHKVSSSYVLRVTIQKP